MGRWSRKVAPLFLDWLAVPFGCDWLDVGCGTGALSTTVIGQCEPRSLVSIDPSEAFIATTRARLPDVRAVFRIGDAQALPVDDGSRDVIVSGLVLNFVPDRAKALAEARRVARRVAVIGFYVWDYPGGGVEFMRAFWTAAVAFDPSAAELSEDRRFPFCTPDNLARLTSEAGFRSVKVTAIEVVTVFESFNDFLGALHARLRTRAGLLRGARAGSAAAAEGKTPAAAGAEPREPNLLQRKSVGL